MCTGFSKLLLRGDIKCHLLKPSVCCSLSPTPATSCINVRAFYLTISYVYIQVQNSIITHSYGIRNCLDWLQKAVMSSQPIEQKE